MICKSSKALFETDASNTFKKRYVMLKTRKMVLNDHDLWELSGQHSSSLHPQMQVNTL